MLPTNSARCLQIRPSDGIYGQSRSVLCELWHPVDRQFGTPPGDGSLSAHLTPRPFVGNQTIPSIGDITFGSGQDGAADFNGVATFTFATLVGGVYTLTRDARSSPAGPWRQASS